MSLDCCFDVDSIFGEEAYKGKYTYNTSLVGDVIHKQCKYNSTAGGNHSFPRTCQGSGNQPAHWEAGLKWERLEKCKTLQERTQELEDLEKELDTKVVS